MFGLKSNRCVLPLHLAVNFPWQESSCPGAQSRGDDDEERLMVCPATIIINGPKIVAVLLSSLEEVIARFPDIIVEDYGDAVIMVRAHCFFAPSPI